MTPLAKLMWMLALCAALIAAFGLHGKQQFELGKVAERAAWQGRENTALVAANSKIKDLEEKYRQQEQDAATALSIISFNYQKDLQDVAAQKDRLLARLRAGAVRLCIPVAYGLRADGGVASATAAATSRRDGAACAELSGEATEFLVGLTSEADAVTKQLGRCQEVLLEYRKFCGDRNGN